MKANWNWHLQKLFVITEISKGQEQYYINLQQHIAGVGCASHSLYYENKTQLIGWRLC